MGGNLLGVLTENSLDVFISDEFRENALRFGLGAIRKVISICEVVKRGSKEGFVKIKNAPVPLIGTHFRDKYRLFFVLGKGKIFFTCIKKRDDQTYSNINRLIHCLIGEPINSKDWLTTGDLSDEASDGPWDVRNEDTEISGLLESPKVRVFSVTENALRTEGLLNDFFKNGYQYHPQLKESQNKTVEALALPGETQVWSIHGPAGSGKTTCAIHLARKIFSYNPSSAILFVVPNERLTEWIEDTCKKNGLACYRFNEETTGMDSLRRAYELQNKRVFITSLSRLLCLFTALSPQDYDPIGIQRRLWKIIQETKDFRFHHWFDYRIENLYDLYNNFYLPQIPFNKKVPLLEEIEGPLRKIGEERFIKRAYQEAKADRLDDYSLLSKAVNIPLKERKAFPFPFHLVVDETQDYTASTIAWLFELFTAQSDTHSENLRQKLVFLSDMNQRIRINDFCPGLIIEYAHKYDLKCGQKELEMHFRSTKEITAFAYDIMKKTFKSKLETGGHQRLPIPVKPSETNPCGDLPCLLVAEREKIVTALEKSISLELFGDERRWVCVREDEGPKGKELENLFANSRGMILDLYASECKGLEFDTIILFDLFPDPEKPLVSEIHRLYTSITRAKTLLLLTIEPERFERYRASQDYPLDDGALNIVEEASEEDIIELFNKFKRNEISVAAILQVIREALEQFERHGTEPEERLVVRRINLLIERSYDIDEICRYAFRFFDIAQSHRHSSYLEEFPGSVSLYREYWSPMLAEYRNNLEEAFIKWGMIGKAKKTFQKKCLIRTEKKANTLKRYRLLLEFGDESLIRQNERNWETEIADFSFISENLKKQPNITDLRLLYLSLRKNLPELKTGFSKLNETITRSSDRVRGERYE